MYFDPVQEILMTDKKPGEQSGMQKLGEGLKEVFGGLFAPSTEQGSAIAPTERRKVTLRYSQEEDFIYEDAHEGDLPSVKEAFEEYSGSLGMDPSRSHTFRKNGSVVDENARVEFGSVYVASLVRSTKG